jgi:glycogen synthase
MKILLATDAFPPVCGGSGWSTYELARGLRTRGHDVVVVQPRPGQAGGIRDVDFDGFRIREFGFSAPSIPYVRNYFKSERLTESLTRWLRDAIASEGVDLVHGQHVMTAIASINAARATGIPAVATVRDYWPVCYWSDLIVEEDGLALCPECTVANMRACIRPRAGALWPLALPMIPYMRANLARKQTGLARADAIVAVSRRIASDLVERAPELAHGRIEVIPNPVNVEELRARASTLDPRTSPYALYLGKLAPNKGTSFLIDVIERANLDWPLVIAGDGPDRSALEREAQASSRAVRFTGWLDRDAALDLLANAAMLIFPSRGPESLSRVLIEASALEIPIAAMDTGGTRDIIEPDVTGLLSSTPEELARDVARLRKDPEFRARLASAARAKVERDFETSRVVARVERLYEELTRR